MVSDKVFFLNDYADFPLNSLNSILEEFNTLMSLSLNLIDPRHAPFPIAFRCVHYFGGRSYECPVITGATPRLADSNLLQLRM